MSTQMFAIPKQSVIQMIMNFPMDDVITRYARDEQLPIEVAKEHERELKRFLALCALNPDRAYGMKGPIDNLWHTFIFFTKKYEKFCLETAGRFIHHQPADSEGLLSQESKERYMRFLEDYEDIFEEVAPPHLWPRIRVGVDGEYASCDVGPGNCMPNDCTVDCNDGN